MLILIIAACTSDPGGAADLSMGFTTALSRVAGPVDTTEADGAAVTIDLASAVLRDIELDLPRGARCSELGASAFAPPVRCSEDKLHIDGPFVVDLIERTSSPELVGLTLPAGAYRRVDLRFDADSAGDDISFVVAGTVDGVAFDLALEVNEDARFEAPGGVVVDASAELLALIDADRLFDAMPLEACIAEEKVPVIDGVVTIGPDTCPDVEDAVEDVLKDAWDLDTADS